MVSGFLFSALSFVLCQSISLNIFFPKFCIFGTTFCFLVMLSSQLSSLKDESILKKLDFFILASVQIFTGSTYLWLCFHSRFLLRKASRFISLRSFHRDDSSSSGFSGVGSYFTLRVFCSTSTYHQGKAVHWCRFGKHRSKHGGDRRDLRLGSFESRLSGQHYL